MTKEEKKEYDKQYYQKNKTKRSSQIKKYLFEHREELYEKNKIYRQTHKKEINERNKKYRKIQNKEYQKQYHLEHLEKAKETNKKYRLEHKEELKKKKHESYLKNKEEIKQKAKIYRQTHKEEIRIYKQKNKEKISIQKKIARRIWVKNPINKLRCYLASRLWSVLKGNIKSEHTMKLTGCSIEFLKTHLEKQFVKGMKWSNWGTGYNGKGMQEWHIDHIIPCSSFDLRIPEQQFACFNYTNLRPLWATENLERPRK